MFKKSDFPRWLILYVLAILLVAGVINLFMHLAIPTAPGLNAPTWLTFWGSYLGGAIGCLPALAALYDNRKEARKQHEESENSRRLAAMPVITFEDNSSSFSLDQIDSLSTLSGMTLLGMDTGFHSTFKAHDPNKYCEKLKQLDASYSGIFFFDFQNIGVGPALNISLSCSNISPHRSIPLKSIGANETRSLLFCIQIPPEGDPSHPIQYDIKITFSDIFGNDYFQVQPLICGNHQHTFGSISLPELILKQEEFNEKKQAKAD